MQSDTATTPLEKETLLAQVAQSRARILELAQDGRLNSERLSELANTEANLALALNLGALPENPREQFLAVYAFTRPYLERLTQHDPAHLVVADETHSYTPRTILRRVLDHALDHLNQIDQWLVWQQQGVVPTPTDGWASSDDTMPEDFQPLSPKELQSWLWRIDLSLAMVAQRAGQLSEQQLDWTPPDGGWTLRYMLRHLAFAGAYYAIWLDEPLPDSARERYQEANARFERQLRQIFTSSNLPDALFLLSDTLLTAGQIVQQALAEEQAFA
jgi:hypothetical protein